MHRFVQRIQIIGVNPYVSVPARISLLMKKKGFIPVKIKVNGHHFPANLVPVGQGRHRLYLHGEMRRKAGAQAGDRVTVELAYDSRPRVQPMSPQLAKLLKARAKAQKAWKQLRPSRRKEILLYSNRLKSPEAVKRNLTRITGYLEGRSDWFGSRISS